MDKQKSPQITWLKVFESSSRPPVAEEIKKQKIINMTFVMNLTKSDPKLMMEMIGLYLEQTPPLITEMKDSFNKKDWKMLYATVHKMIPSFSIVGISIDFWNHGKKNSGIC